MLEEESLTCDGREKKEIGGQLSQWPETWLQVFFLINANGHISAPGSPRMKLSFLPGKTNG